MFSPFGRLLPVDNIPDIHYSSELGITHADFFRYLPKAMGEHEYRIDGTTVYGKVFDGTVEISIGEPQERRIALVCIPYAEVSFLFRGVTAEQYKVFKQHFDLRFQRGGG